jgi:hypothetical protein
MRQTWWISTATLLFAACALQAPVEATTSTHRWGVGTRTVRRHLAQLGASQGAAGEITAVSELLVETAAELMQDVDRQSSTVEAAEVAISPPVYDEQDKSVMQDVDRRSHPRLRL